MARAVETVLLSNRRILRDFKVLETFEAGIVLSGPEVKSLRQRHASIREAYARIERGEVFVYKMTIQPYAQGGIWNPEAGRPLKLLLNRAEIDRIVGKWGVKNTVIIPLKAYLKNRRIKLEIAVMRRKEGPDRRDEIKKQDLLRELRQETRVVRKG
ncbi:MAG: SsrA-binding protein SmpB [Nitrospirae bacterium]|nr:SsrA-binding protein SmpB [Nitrospirota bacterium]